MKGMAVSIHLHLNMQDLAARVRFISIHLHVCMQDLAEDERLELSHAFT